VNQIKNQNKFKKNVLAGALVLSFVLMAIKFYTYFITGSNAILTDALESIINFVAGSFALYSVILASKPKDLDHPYGHGKIEFLSSGLEGTLISLAGLSIIGKAIYGFFYPHQIQQLDLGMLAIAFTGAANYGAGRYLQKTGARYGSLTMIANGKHLLTDAWSSLGLVLGLGIIYFTGLVWLDNVVAILFGSFIIYTGYGILRNSISGVMDEADHELIERITEILNRKRRPAWIDLHNMRVIKYGNQLHIDCHLTLPWYFNLVEAHQEMDLFQLAIAEEMEEPIELFIHLDPCLEQSCAICTLQECNVRKKQFQHRITWTLENVIENKKHTV
jgi:cation diffusion facilitator family transporter